MKKVEFYRHDLGDAEIASLRETLGGPFLTLGPRVGVFEKMLAAELSVPHVVGTSSCTISLQMLLAALDVGPGDEVISPAITWISTPNAALYVGATPVLVDVEKGTGLVDAAAVERAITPRTKAIFCVHLYGQMADMVALRAIADRHRIPLLEDSAHGFESERDRVRPGQLGDAAAFSFYATKTITSGDGGAIATRRAELDVRLRRLRNHGVSKDAASRYGGTFQHWDMVELGFKGALTDVQAALLIPQMERAHARRARREAIADRYEKLLGENPQIELVPRVGRSTHHLFPVLVPREKRELVLARLSERGIGLAVNYRAIHTLTYYRERFAIPESALPVAADIGARTVSLPMWPDLPLEDVDHVASELERALA